MTELLPRRMTARHGAHSPVLVAVAVVVAGCAGAARPTQRSYEPEEPPRVAVALRFVEASPGEQGTPRTRVLLVRIGRQDKSRERTELGTYAGACAPSPVVAPVVLRARCWWGEQSSVLEVRREDDVLVARRRPERAGDWTELTRVELPQGARLDPIRPGVSSH